MSDRTPNRILMTADSIGGVWSYALELVEAVRPRGIEVLLAVMGVPLSSCQREEAAEVENLQIEEGRFKLEWMENPWRDVDAAGEWLLDLAREFKPDLVHLNGFVHAALPWDLPVLVAAHSCVLSWWRAVRGGEVPEEWAGYKQRVREGLWSANLIAAPSRAMLRAIQNHYNPPGDCRVIPNGRRLDGFAPARKEPIILCAGRAWDEAKNLTLLCAAAPSLSWPVFVAGDWGQPGRGAAARPRNLQCLGRLQAAEMRDWFGRAAIFAHPAKYEPFGLSVLEAALSGCALVLGDIPSLRENWEGAALFVDPESPGQLHDTIEGLIQQPGRRDHLAQAARARARRFDIELTAEMYLEAWSDLAAAKHPPQPAMALPA